MEALKGPDSRKELGPFSFGTAGLVAAVSFLATLAAVDGALAQVEIRLEPDMRPESDTVWVDVRLVAEHDSLQESIRSFQFEVFTGPEVHFIGSDDAYSLSGKSGWMTRSTAKNGRVGGFSSSLDAIIEAGVLIRLQFMLSGTDTPGYVELRDFRLNSGSPDHFPEVPSLSLNLVKHQE